MEPNDDGHPIFTTAITATPMDMGLYLSLGLLVAIGATPKPLSTAINLTHVALKGTRALRHLPSPTSPESLLLASKALVHGYKISKSLNLRRPKSISFLYKRLKPCFGAINLVRYARSPFADGGYLGFGVLSYGYKLSKNLVRVLEGFVGVEVDAAVRNGFDAAGMVFKTVKVAREVGRMVGGGEGKVGWCWFACAGGPSMRGGVCARLEEGMKVRERLDLVGGVAVRRGKEEMVNGSCGHRDSVCLGDLFCLSVPLDERLMLCCLL